MLLTLLLALSLTLVALKIVARDERYPRLWQFLFAVAVGNLAAMLLAPVLSPTPLAESLRVWLWFSPAVVIAATLIWCRLVFAGRRKDRGSASSSRTG